MLAPVRAKKLSGQKDKLTTWHFIINSVFLYIYMYYHILPYILILFEKSIQNGTVLSFKKVPKLLDGDALVSGCR